MLGVCWFGCGLVGGCFCVCGLWVFVVEGGFVSVVLGVFGDSVVMGVGLLGVGGCGCMFLVCMFMCECYLEVG
jgi:hypothetical protein